MKHSEIWIFALLFCFVKCGWYYGNDEIDPVTGMTGQEKSSVKSTWKYMMRDPSRYGSIILNKYFQKYPEYLGYFPFDDVSSKEFTNQKDFKVYLNLMMYTLDSIIDNLEKNPTIMKAILKKLGKNHSKNNVKVEPFWNLRDMILEIMEPMVNSNTHNAWMKFLNLAMDYITSSMEESNVVVNTDRHSSLR